ncbi:transcriptional regulator with PAS, ATPase and Fis domain [Acetoanaerobium pronyense]|uniref:Transcriptional regulator with PAS, ATPase and Fis domain n=1 Tax=Acetoanaerobium pronyense TaxID=1482736 RepID=A0ABS4KNP3_9FIRM|nr:sigma-54 dependent transcriptional regulator [Acetoanaerobium pronyense]MBP2028836.1 transcriptional regulator with PAS, ATPase and Fis domain [Acetoanaerobium pronyense]
MRRKSYDEILKNKAIYTFDKLIGKSQIFLDTIDYAKKLATSSATIFIQGESGTGKELFAHAIHNYSERKESAFIAVNCGAIPHTLIESELFGYEEGSFTGAKKGGQVGKFEQADSGTIFLDEIGEMPLSLQIRLLRVIEEGVVDKVGGKNPIPVDVRIIAATNKNLKLEVEKGRFRQDLYYRIFVLPLFLPTLKERKEDIPILFEYFLEKSAKRNGVEIPKISKEEVQKILNNPWSGNIRELENAAELYAITGSFPTSFIELERATENFPDKMGRLEKIEKTELEKAIILNERNLSKTAIYLGVSRSTLYRMLKKYNIG